MDFKPRLRMSFHLCGLFLLAYLIGFRSSKTTRQTIAFLIPVVGFASAFILISNETNFGGRFQYALLPIVLLSWFPLVRGLDREIGLPALGGIGKRQRGFVIASLSVIAVLILSSSYNQGVSIGYSRDGRYDMAQALQPYSSRGYTMATSEAGLLPLYSQWKAIDTWGLNDEWIAHNGGITADYLDRYKPELIIFHAHFSPLVSADHARSLSRSCLVCDDDDSKGLCRKPPLHPCRGVWRYAVRYTLLLCASRFADSQTIVHLISKFNRYAWAADGWR